MEITTTIINVLTTAETFWFIRMTSTRERISNLKHVALLTRLDKPKMYQVSESTLLGFNMLQFMSSKN